MVTLGPDAVQLKRALDEFLIHLRIERQLSPHTCDAYFRDNTQFIKFLGHLNLEAKHLMLFSNELMTRGLSHRTVVRKQSALAAFCLYLYKEGVLSWKVGRFIVKPKLESRLPKVVKSNEIDRLIQAAKKSKNSPFRDALFIELMYSCGLRISECCDLKLKDLATDYETVKVFGKGKKHRVVPVGREAKACLSSYLKQERVKIDPENKKETLFISAHQKPFSRQAVYQIVKKLTRKTGVEVTPHMFRHSFATHLLEGNANIREVQELLGHQNIKTTQIYTKVSQKHLKDVYDKFHPKA